ncbi:type II secretion system protein N [Legionella fallonii]|uniref:General secretion pathway protein C n=1 Tax=Legionella fallonii LLAP-10 TaxID=1212491 RepID=A0A098G344_9GAMM|nr:type II secretion system protein N [Legionella fallonii]CEG56406.1 General secretion pathway protein C [Legionella fallonii LLAP-10]
MKFDIHYLVSSKYAKWIVIGFISLFSLLIVFEYSKLVFPVGVTSIAPGANTLSGNKTKEDTSNYILNSSLFGVYVPNDLNEGNVKKSMLNVTLVGILLGDVSKESQVIIRASGGEENTYRIGDKIPGGAVIKRIMAHGILVERNGALESLSLPKNDLIFEPAAEPLKEE